MSITCGEAALLILINAILAKLWMSCYWRLQIITAGDKRKRSDIVQSRSFKTAHAAQLNDAEYSPLFVAELLFLHVKEVNTPLLNVMAVFGSVQYFWGKIFLPFPGHLPGVVARYGALAMLCWEIFNVLNA